MQVRHNQHQTSLRCRQNDETLECAEHSGILAVVVLVYADSVAYVPSASTLGFPLLSFGLSCIFPLASPPGSSPPLALASGGRRWQPPAKRHAQDDAHCFPANFHISTRLQSPSAKGEQQSTKIDLESTWRTSMMRPWRICPCFDRRVSRWSRTMSLTLCTGYTEPVGGINIQLSLRHSPDSPDAQSHCYSPAV
jgi:hypothetical protein